MPVSSAQPRLCGNCTKSPDLTATKGECTQRLQANVTYADLVGSGQIARALSLLSDGAGIFPQLVEASEQACFRRDYHRQFASSEIL